MPTGSQRSLRRTVAEMLAEQATHCRSLGSELYAALLVDSAEDCAAGGPTWDVLEPVATDSWEAALALRFMAAVHAVVLRGDAPDLARHYPSTGGDGSAAAAWPAFRAALVEQREELTRLARQPCQTNEAARSRALAVGFLTLASELALPLRLLEVGASAGLNLRWDHYRFADDASDRAWGPPDSPVQLVGRWDVPEELLRVDVRVAERHGCDPAPIPLDTQDGRVRLLASLWADQVDRVHRLRAAIDVARRVPVVVSAAAAREWLPHRLAALPEGVVTVVYHSVVWQYLGKEDREAVVAAVVEAGARATPSSPLAWLRMEPDRPGRNRMMELRLTLWPGGSERLLAMAGAHGFPVEAVG